MNEEQTLGAVFALGGLEARKICIDMVLTGTEEPVQARTLEALQRDRRRIAMLIAGDNDDLRRLVDAYTMASEQQGVCEHVWQWAEGTTDLKCTQCGMYPEEAQENRA